jgi:hypothetical protein
MFTTFDKTLFSLFASLIKSKTCFKDKIMFIDKYLLSEIFETSLINQFSGL